MLLAVDLNALVEHVGKAIDGVGVAVIVLGAAFAGVALARRELRGPSPLDNYREFREALGRSILLGLEFLVAGDIVRTVAGTPTFESVGILAIIVLIRTFLSFTLNLEVTGRWPWDRGDNWMTWRTSPTTGSQTVGLRRLCAAFA